MSCFGIASGSRHASPTSKEIDLDIKKDRLARQEKLTCVVLGCEGSGASTFMKQMKILHLSGFSDAEQAEYKSKTQAHLIQVVGTLLERVQGQIEDQTAVLVVHKNLDDLIAETRLRDHFEIDEDLRKAIDIVMKEPAMQEIANSFDITTSALAYFIDEYERIIQKDYHPDIADILRTPTKRCFQSISFQMDGLTWDISNMSCHLNSSSTRWLEQFDSDSVAVLLFIVALDSYDCFMEDGQNQLLHTLEVYSSVINHPSMRGLDITLFFNKRDVFEEKLKATDLSVCFPTCSVTSIANAYSYIQKQFQAKDEQQYREIYSHCISALDTANVRVIFKAVNTTTLHQVISRDFLF